MAEKPVTPAPSKPPTKHGAKALGRHRTSNEESIQRVLLGAERMRSGEEVPHRRRSGPVVAVGGALPQKGDAKYDYVFVGGGTAAAVAAARMAEAGLKVLLLEAGKDARADDPKAAEPIESQIPAAHAIASESRRLAVGGKNYKVKHRSDDEKNAADPNWDPEAKGVLYPRGEGIGGSARMNAMIWVRPDDVDWEIIAKATGNPRWSPKNMRKIFQRIERIEYRPLLRVMHEIGKALNVEALKNPHGLGMDGWLHINRPNPAILLEDPQLLKLVWETVKFSMKEVGTLDEKLARIWNAFDPNDARLNQTEGLTLTPLAVTKDGRRNGARNRLFEARAEHPDRIEIRSGARVEKVLLDSKNEVRGVRYTDRDGKVADVGARHGVIVAAGAFETPAVLLRSGLGKKAELTPLGIKAKVELPGVGEGLSDRYEYGHTFQLKEPLKALQDLRSPLGMIEAMAAFGASPLDIEEASKHSPALQRWLEGKAGFLATNGSPIAFQAKSDPSLAEPDLYLFMAPGSFTGYHDGYAREAVDAMDQVTLVILHENKTDSRGKVALDPQDPSGQPLINFQYHEEDHTKEDDRLPLARAVIKYGRPLIKAYGALVHKEVAPGPELESVEAVAEKIGRGTWGHHANHTARIGDPKDALTVVDGNLEVVGTKGLFVADASVLHNSGSFIVSSVVAVAEVMADIAVERAKAEEAEGASKLRVRQVQSAQISRERGPKRS